MTNLNSELSIDELDMVAGGELAKYAEINVMGFTIAVGQTTTGVTVGQVYHTGTDGVSRNGPLYSS
ncbi:MAG: hypothetical protein ABI192_02185 [Bradyrhizobium sp.]